jgi:hypothetical protein
MFSSKKNFVAGQPQPQQSPTSNYQRQQQLQAATHAQNLSQHQQQMMFHQQHIDYLKNASSSNISSSNTNQQQQQPQHHLHHFKSDVRTKNVLVNANNRANSQQQQHNSQPILSQNNTMSPGSVCVTLGQTPTNSKLATQMKIIASNNIHTGKIYKNENLHLK